jgi:Ca2+-binding EF-hand superfamily protein
MLVPEKNRYNTKEVLAHPWLKQYKENLEINQSLILNIMKNYSKMNYIKKNILNFIGSRLDENNNNDINSINQYFKLFDKDNDGQISYEEFENVLINMNVEKNEIRGMFNSLDVSKNDIINYTEFVAAFLEKDTHQEKNICLNREIINEAFTFFDKSNKGRITKEDVKNIFNVKNIKNNEKIKQILNELDNNKDAYIDRNTFEQLINEH